MTNEEKIDYMIQSLQLAKEEITYAKKCKKESKKASDYYYYYDKRLPNGTIIRESLKMVGRMANIVAKNVVLSPYTEEIFKEDN